MSQFLVVGDVAVDQMYFVSRFPEHGGEVAADRALMEPGGSGGTVAAVLARLGNATSIATRIGTGPFSQLAVRYLEQAGVDMHLVQHDGARQTASVTLIITPDAQRTMLSSSGASRFLDPSALGEADVARCDALVMSAYSLVAGSQKEYAVRALDYARRNSVTTFMDLGTGAINAVGEGLIPHIKGVDYLLMNEHELYLITGRASISEAIADLRNVGLDNLVVKVGAMGSIVITPELNELVEAHEVTGVVDTTGAGDYYTATFAHAVMGGHDLITAAMLANVAGALCTTKVGAQSMSFDSATLERHASFLTSSPA